jgi:threonine dehydratase
MKAIKPIPLEEIRAAQKRIAGSVIRTPLVRLNVDDAPAEIYLKLENLQPTGAFKLRGVYNFIGLAKREELKNGVWTLSSGNHGQAVAWVARQLGLECTVFIPEAAAADKKKINAIKQFGAKVVKASDLEFFEIMRDRSREGMKGLFIHPFCDPAIMAGQGTIGLEILEDLPDVDTIIIPWGGGGLCCGIASAIRALKPSVKIYACEVETGAPLAASFAAGEPVWVEYTPSFVTGIGTPLVFPEMWELAKQLVDGSLVVGLAEIAAAIRLIVERNRVVAEGAGATPVAAALAGKAGKGKVVCVVSGGNIDNDKLAKILLGEVPKPSINST